MKIESVKTCFKIADVKIDRSDILRFDFLPIIKDENGKVLNGKLLKENIGRVYLLAVNGIIKKIGGSEDKGGMIGTLEIYKTGGLNGQPSPRSIGIWWHMFHEISNKNNVEIYMIYQDNFKGNVKGLFGVKEKTISISYKHLENECLADYYSIEKKYPEWNYQENHDIWPDEIETLHAITKKNKSKKGIEKNLNFADELKKAGFKTEIKRSRNDYK